MEVFFKLVLEEFSEGREDALNVILVLAPFGKSHEAIEAIFMGSEFILGILAALDLLWPSGRVPEVKL